MITILMAIYNGETYLREQIESIIAQTFTDWRLILCDDCSKDSSFEIASDYATRYPGKIVAVRNPEPSGSAQNNFMDMLCSADDDYIMFSDQDDVWLPDKIRLTYDEMKRQEGQSPETPVLVHTDLFVTDGELNVLSRSFMKYSGFNARYNSLNRLLVQNNISGCTTMINRSLTKRATGINLSRIIMHDWWIGLVASAFGRVGFVKTPTILYRQHSGNQVGAKNAMSLRYFLGLAKRKMSRSGTGEKTALTEHPIYVQAMYFYERFADELSPEQRKMLRAYLDLPKKNKICRICVLIRYRLLRQRAVYMLGQLVFC